MPSASVTAPTRTLSQSASVRGRCSSLPLRPEAHQTASKMLSASGSIMLAISSLTDTTGVISPSSGVAASDVEGVAAVLEQCDEMADARNNAPAKTINRPPRRSSNTRRRRAAKSRCLLLPLGRVGGGLGLCLALRLQRVEFFVAEIDDVHPRVRHLVDSAIAEADP